MRHPTAGGAFRLRFAENDVEERIAAVRAWFGDQGRTEFLWWVGPSSTPGALESRLREGGATPWDDGVIASMLATEPPPPVEDIQVRKVERYEDFVLAREIAWATAGFTDEQAREVGATLPHKWEDRRRSDNGATYLAYVDEEPVAAADILFLPFAGFLSGASTKPEHRGRGAFRALVRARWDAAAERGTPALIVGAGKHVAPDPRAPWVPCGRRAARARRPGRSQHLNVP